MLTGLNMYKLLVDINKFQIHSTIGGGTFGEVKKATYPAQKKKPECECAVKFLKSESIRNSSALKAFHNEIECQAKLNHIAVLPIIGYSIPFGGKGSYTIVTDYMPNGSLFSLISKVSNGLGPSDWELRKAINIFGIAAGMAYIHKRNIIHRDLKTENVLLDEKFYPKISDFGFSKFYEDGITNQLNMTMNLGSACYMAPELVYGDEHYTNKVDVFAYAIILYEILTLKKPYENAKFDLKKLHKFVNDGVRPEINEGEVSEDFAQLIKDCWDNDPNVRPSFENIVLKFIENKESYFDPIIADDDEFKAYVDDAIEQLNLA